MASAKEYTPAPVWVASSACGSPQVQQAILGHNGRVLVPRPAPVPQLYFVNDQPEE